jgi:cytochrome bd-type quinol oxidase subunit 1
MNGIFSGSPCSASIRLMVGTHLLLLVQSALVLWSAPDLGGNQPLVWLTLLLGLGAFVCAVRGEVDGRQPWWKGRRRGR